MKTSLHPVTAGMNAKSCSTAPLVEGLASELLMFKCPLRILSISDIHLGHRRNSASEIIANLRCAVADNPETAQLDIIFLAGDVFDTLLNLPSNHISEIDGWIQYMLRLCKKYNILLRILEGTPSHDWKQSRRFVEINELWEIGCDLKYHETLTIEYIEQFDRHVLYIPDQYSDSTEKTLVEVKTMMRARGLEQVDIGIMHGQFDFQVPDLEKVPKHNSAEYAKLVREIVSIGHDHHYARQGHLVAQGSFDRLAHGEEEPKGHIRAFLLGDGSADITFVENTRAKKFITIDCRQLDAQQSMNHIGQALDAVPEGSHARVLVQPGHALASSVTGLNLFVRMWPLYVWSKPKIDLVEEKLPFLEGLESVAQTYHTVQITRENIEKLLMERMEQLTQDPRVLEYAALTLKEVV